MLHVLVYLKQIHDIVKPLDLPILVDIDIFHSCQKLLYSSTYNAWDVQAWLRPHPLLFGLWHAYKHCVVQVYSV